MKIHIKENQYLEVKVRYNREEYNGMNKGFYLYVTLKIKEEHNGYNTYTFSPLDSNNFKYLLKEAKRYNAKKEQKYNNTIENNAQQIKKHYENMNYQKLINIVMCGE